MIELSTGAVLDRRMSHEDFLIITHHSSEIMETFDPCRRCLTRNRCRCGSSRGCIDEYYARWKEAGYIVPIRE